MNVDFLSSEADVILHSDRGSEFANQLHAETWKGKVIRSMSGSGKCYDNAMAQSFFATLKLEAIQGHVFATRSDVVWRSLITSMCPTTGSGCIPASPTLLRSAWLPEPLFLH
jgi:transposase InsO family protein